MLPTSRPRAVRRAAAATITTLALGGLVACGNDSPDADSGEASQVEEMSADLEAGDDVDVDEFMATMSDGLEASTTAHVTMRMGLGSTGELTAEGDIDNTQTPPEMAMTMTSPMGGGDMDMRLVDGVMYMSMGQLTQGKFIELDLSDPKGPLAGMGMDGLLEQMDPATSLKAMEDGISQVVFVGEEDELDHYELTVDMDQFLEQMDGDLPPAATSELPESVTYDLWLDDEGRFSKFSMDELPMGGASGSMEMSFSAWGEDVDIEAPAKSEITEMPDFGSMMEGMPSSA